MVETKSTAALRLFAQFPGLQERLAWTSIGRWPTPVIPLRAFGAAHGLPSLHLKREDLSHTECGGNKVRGLEFLLAEAQHRGATTLVTWGVAGSHHICRTGWHARNHGLATTALVIDQPRADYVEHNLRFGLAAGVRYLPCSAVTLAPRLGWCLATARLSGSRPLYVPAGGTCPLSCVGQVGAALELADQVAAGALPAPDFLFVSLGSLGTAAGLVLGCKLAGLPTRIVGVVVSFRWYCTPRRVLRLARRTLDLMRRCDAGVPRVPLGGDNLIVFDRALGAGYARPTEAGTNLTRELERLEGLSLEPTYTAKMFDGACQFIRAHDLRHRTHLLWHTYHPVTAPAGVSVPRRLRRYLR
jgi:D-cysteine desulfhydrase